MIQPKLSRKQNATFKPINQSNTEKQTTLYSTSDDTLNVSDNYTGDNEGPYLVNGTIIYYHNNYYTTCNTMPNYEVVYLGVKISDAEGEKLGWVKLALLQDSKLIIFETALQE